MKSQFGKRQLLCSIVLSIIAAVISTTWAEPTPEPLRTQRTQWWRQAKFGMFIHWGIYAVPAGEWKGEITDEYSEWIMFHKKIPIAEYEQLAKQFDPVKFDADAWAKLAKQAGMKYMIITSKHHDGFAMFDSKVSDYNIVTATPFGRDVIKELSDACAKEGIKFGVYYSVDRDWHHPNARGNQLNQTNTWDYHDESKRDFDSYFNNFAKKQIEELLTQYKLSILWFDGIGIKTNAQNEDILALMKKYQPDCLVNSRLGDWMSYEWGDYRSMDDNEVSNRDLGYGWENPGTINHTYGYNKHDRDWKNHTEIIHMLVDIASNGGNYLLNIGPRADGTIPAESIRVLQEVGKWMDKFGESIYATIPAPVPKPDWGRLTAKDDKLFLHVFDWPMDDMLVVDSIEAEIKNAYLLADKEQNKLSFEKSEEQTIIELNTISMYPDALDSSDTVIVLETDN
ncbi:MAG: alpha-L-fucosidase [Planctomycetota bacterium]|jgi:alpha-L-fucosidase